MKLSDLIKMTKKFARILKMPEMSAKADSALQKFNLALHLEIKSTDYRSTFTDV